MFLMLNNLTGKREVIHEAHARAAIVKTLGQPEVEPTIQKLQDGAALAVDGPDKVLSWVWTREEWATEQAAMRAGAAALLAAGAPGQRDPTDAYGTTECRATVNGARTGPRIDWREGQNIVAAPA